MATYLYDSNYINIQEKTKLQRQCKDQWSPGACGEEEWLGGAQETFRAMKLSYDTVMVDTWH